MSLSKLHVRFIQSQEYFHIQQGNKKLPISHLYVKDTNYFYLVLEDALTNEDSITIVFKEKTPALNSLSCTCKGTKLSSDSEDYEDALLFFHVNEDKIKQVLSLELQDLSDS
ncbi:hypothetical protein JHD50_01000 [Sulfurimonas sp. MAG313]|nr:hypothetical protein [Sulfurimonas sp. MAG313]MDF1879888.1 hypothetical protein [Sulfurimonas sp. MAG313]